MEDLFELVADGDHAAFESLYQDAFPLVFHTVLAVLADNAQAEEVTQEVFLEIWCTAPRYDRRLGTVRTWMATIARRRAIDRVRSAQAARCRDTGFARDVEATTRDAADLATENLTSGALLDALDELRAEQRELLVQAYLRGISYRELAARDDIPLSTVKSRVRLALTTLRRRMYQFSD